MRVELPTPSGPAWADLDRPRSAARVLLVLTHGASGGVNTGDLAAVRAAALKAGIAVALLTQPFRVLGRRAPSAPAKQDADWLAAIGVLRRRRGLARLPLVVGGRSNGARVAARTAPAVGAAAVVALAFPLHPPGKPEQSRAGDLEVAEAAGLPVLVVQGDRDAFGRPEPAPGREIVVVPGADHALRRDPTAVAAAVVGFVTSRITHARVET
jgi:uncharacterized protein